MQKHDEKHGQQAPKAPQKGKLVIFWKVVKALIRVGFCVYKVIDFFDLSGE